MQYIVNHFLCAITSQTGSEPHLLLLMHIANKPLHRDCTAAKVFILFSVCKHSGVVPKKIIFIIKSNRIILQYISTFASHTIIK